MMLGLAMQTAGAVANLIGSTMENEKITKQGSIYDPDPTSFRDAGLHNNSVNLGEQKFETTEEKVPGLKKGLLIAGSLLGAGGGIASGLENNQTEEK